MRLIDADALLKVIEEKVCEPQYMHNGEDWEVGLVIAETLVQYAPTVDAVPVEWIEIDIEESAFSGYDMHSYEVATMLEEWKERNEE